MVKNVESLREIEKSLNVVKPAEPPAVVKSEDSAESLTEALLKLPEVSRRLNCLLQEQQRQTDAVEVLTKLEFDVKQSLAASKSNLAATKALLGVVQERLRFIDATDAKFQRLIVRVDSVLEDLERVLRRELNR